MEYLFHRRVFIRGVVDFFPPSLGAIHTVNAKVRHVHSSCFHRKTSRAVENAFFANGSYGFFFHCDATKSGFWNVAYITSVTQLATA